MPLLKIKHGIDKQPQGHISELIFETELRQLSSCDDQTIQDANLFMQVSKTRVLFIKGGSFR